MGHELGQACDREVFQKSEMMHANSESHCFRTAYALRRYAQTRRLWDTPILETHSFVVLPTVGPLVEGWLLIVPKTRVLSFACVARGELAQLEAVLEKTVALVEEAYGPVAIFEHGAAASNDRVGCGVDYAHLHVVPTTCNLLFDAQVIAPNIDWKTVDSLAAIRCLNSDNYWFVQQNYYDRNCYLGRLRYGEPPSQLFRQVIASDLGRQSAYDWKQDPHEQLIAATVGRLAHRAALA
jgi:ATP adenylyltransferase